MITLAICTYNRSESLACALRSLAEQVGIDWHEFEVLVVDNNCTDDTAETVAAFRDRLPIRRVVETSQGLSFARNRALSEARGEWVIFTDDDVILDDRWLGAYADAIAGHPDASYAGGRILPRWVRPQPTWFRGEHLDLLDGVLVWFDIGTTCRPMLSDDPPPFGASIAVRLVPALGAGAFRTDLGVRGTSNGRGEETDLFMRLRSIGANGIYVGNAVCWHTVDDKRLTLVSLYRYGVSSGIAHRAITNTTERGSLIVAASHICRGALQLIKGRGDRFRQCVIMAGLQHGLKAANNSVTSFRRW